MINIDKIQLPYSIEIWKSKIPVKFIIDNVEKLVINANKKYLKINNIYYAEVKIEDSKAEVIRLINNEENDALSKRCDKYKIEVIK